MHIQLLHTSASLTINENWDPDVRDDMEMMLNRYELFIKYVRRMINDFVTDWCRSPYHGNTAARVQMTCQPTPRLVFWALI